MLLELNGCVPLTKTYVKTPKLYMSGSVVNYLCIITSGAT